jgi:hypothetical protein
MLTTRRESNLTTGEAVSRGYQMDGSFVAVLVDRAGNQYRLGTESGDAELDAADQLVATWKARGDRVVE